MAAEKSLESFKLMRYKQMHSNLWEKSKKSENQEMGGEGQHTGQDVTSQSPLAQSSYQYCLSAWEAKVETSP